MQPNPPVNADARDVPARANAVGARAGYWERYAALEGAERPCVHLASPQFRARATM